MYSRNWHTHFHEGRWTSPVLKGRTVPFYALLRMSTETRVVPEWKTYANSCVKKGTAKLIQLKKLLTIAKNLDILDIARRSNQRSPKKMEKYSRG